MFQCPICNQSFLPRDLIPFAIWKPKSVSLALRVAAPRFSQYTKSEDVCICTQIHVLTPIAVCIFVYHGKPTACFQSPPPSASQLALLLSLYVWSPFPTVVIFATLNPFTYLNIFPTCMQPSPLFGALLPCRWLLHSNPTSLYTLNFMLPCWHLLHPICYAQPPLCRPV